jgi:hypothetical protein
MEKIMNKTTTHKDSLDVCADLPLEDHELDSVSGGQGAARSAPSGGPMGMIQQLMQQVQQLTQG